MKNTLTLVALLASAPVFAASPTVTLSVPAMNCASCPVTIKAALSKVLGVASVKSDYRGVPSVAFTLPPIASVGVSEEQARRKGMKFRIKCELVPTWFTARQAAENVYGYKVLVDETTDLILGAHLVGPRVDEVINLFAMAIRHGLTAEELKSTMFAYPTGASDVGYML